MKLFSTLALTALAVGVIAWNDGNGEVDSNSFSLLIEKSIGDSDNEYNKSINTSLQTEVRNLI